MMTLLLRNVELRTSVTEAYTVKPTSLLQRVWFAEKQRKTFLHHLSHTNREASASDQNTSTTGYILGLRIQNDVTFFFMVKTVTSAVVS